MGEIIASTYELLEKIGAGGGGSVYLANHLRLDKRVVLKIDKRKITTRPELLRREVDVLKDLSHTYIPQVYDFFSDGEKVYTVMDYIAGESLDRPLKRGERFSQAQVIKWGVQLLEALCYLHSPTHGSPPHGFVHSDIKPANLMRRPSGDICLIDFNISLAIGEESVVGASAGYASPEHYGLDFSFSGNTLTQATETVVRESETVTLTRAATASSTSRRNIVPDARSDIYSVGATLYHLLSGEKPNRSAVEVKPLSKKEFSPQIVEILTKAMNPNPDLRYQSAEEMLDAFLHLRENDPRTKRLKRRKKCACILLATVFLLGGAMTFVGLKQMERIQSAYTLAEYSQNALQRGDVQEALRYAMEALPEKGGLFSPPHTAQAQYALTEALGVYDLSDGFKRHLAIDGESEILKLAVSPDGEYTAVLTQGMVTVYQTENGQALATLPANQSAFADIVFCGEDVLLYAGADGLCAYDLHSGQTRWHGEKATAIAVSTDGSTVAAVYKDEAEAHIYAAADGTLLHTVDFAGKHQQSVVNDIFADPDDDLLALSATGRYLAASFSDGSLWVFDLSGQQDVLKIYDGSAHTHFEGAFCGDRLAYAANGSEKAEFVVWELSAREQMGAFYGTMPYRAAADENGIYVALDNVLVSLDPVTGAQTERAFTPAAITAFSIADDHTVVATEEGIVYTFDETSALLECHTIEGGVHFLQFCGEYAAVASMDTPTVQVLKSETHKDTQVFTYDADYPHNELRLSTDRKTAMLFSYDIFRIYGMDGTLLSDTRIPDAPQVYDQQYRRENSWDYLDVIYNDGLIRRYRASDGVLVEEKQGEKPDGTLAEEFFTDTYRIASPLHGTPVVYDRETGEQVCELEKDAYLTYVTQVGEYIVTEYISAQGERYGLLLDSACQTLARLPHLCDILPDGTLLFDDMRGNLRQSRIYSIQELKALANN